MWDFSGDEVLFFVIASIVALITTVRWYYIIGRAKTFRPSPARVILALLPLVLVIVLLVVLATLADPVYVAGKLDYTLLFTAGGVAWMFVSAAAFALLGVNARDDALERRNLAAGIAIAGGLAGVMFAYAGSNVGNGPTIWTTLVPALVATLTLFATWGVLEGLTDTAEAVTVERDLATAVRVGAFLACAGAVLGRAMAGDFDVEAGYSGTMRDFALLAWPVLAMIPVMVVLHHFMRPTPARPNPSLVTAGLVPAAALVALTIGYLLALGMPQVAPPGQYGRPPAVERAS